MRIRPAAYNPGMTSTMHWDAARYVAEASFVPTMAGPLLDLLAPQAGETVLDLGCGDGALTASVAARGAEVLGVDSSAAQLALARARGLAVELHDAHALPFGARFDAVFSNAALHWMKAPDRVLEGVNRALKPGGRFVAEMGGAGNIASIVSALEAGLQARGIDPAPLNPWFFPTPARYAQLLENAGLVVNSLQYFARPTPFSRDVGDWLTLMAVPFLSAVSDPAALVDEVRDRLRPQLLDEAGVWQLDYVRLRFVAMKPV